MQVPACSKNISLQLHFKSVKSCSYSICNFQYNDQSTLSSAAPWDDDSLQGGGDKNTCGTNMVYISANFKAYLSGIKNKCGLHIIRLHLEKTPHNFEYWPSYQNFCSPYKNSKNFLAKI